MVLRQQGLSLAKTTAFGLCVASRASGWQVLRDHLSGLETDTGHPQNLYLLADAADRRPLIGMGEPGRPMHLTIRLDGHAWDSPVVRNLIDHFDGVSLDCLESRRLGAGAWLDEWERSAGESAAEALVQDICRMLHGCRKLEVAVRNRGHRGTARFQPSFIDSSGTVLRVADRARHHVVHADVANPGFRLAMAEPSCLRMAVEDVAV